MALCPALTHASSACLEAGRRSSLMSHTSVKSTVSIFGSATSCAGAKAVGVTQLNVTPFTEGRSERSLVSLAAVFQPNTWNAVG